MLGCGTEQYHKTILFEGHSLCMHRKMYNNIHHNFNNNFLRRKIFFFFFSFLLALIFFQNLEYVYITSFLVWGFKNNI